MNEKITIEKLDNGWLLTVNSDTNSTRREAYESAGNLMMGIATAFSGGASRLNMGDKENITIQCRKFR